MNEITGQLIGGPDDGNMVTVGSEIETIPVVSTTQLWLDGLDKWPAVVICKGNYVYKRDAGYFQWVQISSDIVRTTTENV